MPKQLQTEVQHASFPLGSRLSTDPLSVPAANGAVVRNLSCVAPGLRIKGAITGEDDLQIDGNVEGTILLPGQRLTVGRSGKLSCNVDAREVIIYGKVVGNLHAADLVEVKKCGSVIGDIRAARFSFEDGASFKGCVEMEGLGVPGPASSRTPIFPTDGRAN